MMGFVVSGKKVVVCTRSPILLSLKVNHGTDVFTHKHIELPASSYICSQAHMYEIN